MPSRWRICPPDPHQVAQTVNRGDGRIEKRTLQTTESLNDYLDGPQVGQAGLIERTRIKPPSGEMEREQHCFVTTLTTLEADPARLLRVCRLHWTIENKSHDVRDAVFHEDASQVRQGALPQIMATLRNTVLNAMRRVGKTNSRSTFTENCARPDAVFAYLFL